MLASVAHYNVPPHNTNHLKTENVLALADDEVFRIKKFDGIWYLGSFPVRFTPTEMYIGEDKSFKTSRGLISLLTRKNLGTGYSSSDLDNYIEMLKITNHHLTKSGNAML